MLSGDGDGDGNEDRNCEEGVLSWRGSCSSSLISRMLGNGGIGVSSPRTNGLAEFWMISKAAWIDFT